MMADDFGSFPKVFDRVYSFTRDTAVDTVEIPTVFQNREVWEINYLSNLKFRLNETKKLVSDKEMERWHQHTASVNPAGWIVDHVRKNFHVELCTQAWCKFYEILHMFPNLVGESKDLVTFHLCEAPGAFISTLNHYLQTKVKNSVKWNWNATTLNPYYEGTDNSFMIADDRLIIGTLNRWHFGDNDVGNLMDLQTFKQTLDRFRNACDLVKMSFFT